LARRQRKPRNTIKRAMRGNACGGKEKLSSYQ
jgi:hypothetical protein